MYNFFQEHNNENRTLHQSGFWGFFLAATVCSKQIVYSSLFDMTLTLMSEFFPQNKSPKHHSFAYLPIMYTSPCTIKTN